MLRPVSILTACSFFLASIQVAHGQSAISYVYDEIGRLTGIIDSSGNAARYSYDAVGNITSIVRFTSSQTSILQFTPTRGLPGTTVTITGTGFSATPSQDSVSFNGTPATIGSATPTQLIVTVPTGATTGPITVTSPTGSVTSAASFIVPGDATANITIGGASATIAIEASGQKAAISFSGTAGQSVSALLTGVSIPSSSVSILNPDGSTLVGPLTMGSSGLFIDPFILPTTGTYTATVTPQNSLTGSFTITLYSVTDVTTSVTPGGAGSSPTIVTTTVPGQNVRLTFAGTSGQKISAILNAPSTQVSISVLNPDGTTLSGPTQVSGSGGFLDAVTLGANGTYTILIDPPGPATGVFEVTVYNIVDVTCPVNGQASTTVPGQNITCSFSGTAGQVVSFDVGDPGVYTQVTPFAVQVTIFNPDSSVLATSGMMTKLALPDQLEGEAFIDATVLPATGTYSILINPAGTYTGYFSTQLDFVPSNASGTVTVGGSPTTINITVPGQNGSVTFSGTASQSVTVHAPNNLNANSNIFSCYATVELIAPDSTVLVSQTAACPATTFDLPSQTLPMTGTYTILVNPLLTATGPATVSVTTP